MSLATSTSRVGGAGFPAKALCSAIEVTFAACARSFEGDALLHALELVDLPPSLHDQVVVPLHQLLHFFLVLGALPGALHHLFELIDARYFELRHDRR